MEEESAGGGVGVGAGVGSGFLAIVMWRVRRRRRDEERCECALEQRVHELLENGERGRRECARVGIRLRAGARGGRDGRGGGEGGRGERELGGEVEVEAQCECTSERTVVQVERRMRDESGGQLEHTKLFDAGLRQQE